MTAPDASLLLNLLDDRLRPTTTGEGTRRRRRKSKQQGEVEVSPTAPNGLVTQPPEQDRLSRRRKPRFLLRRRTWALPLILILAFVSCYAANPSDSNIARRFLFLSYRLDDDRGDGDGGSRPPQYGKGPWDIALVCFYTAVLSFAREFVTHELLRPLARALGIAPRAKRSRFAEQMYTASYIAFVGPLGLHCMRQTPVWYFDTRGMYEAFPHRTHGAELKFYYLFQAAFWAQQAIVMVLGVEKRRKDFRELVAHHVVTITLIGLSYQFHFTYIGIAVYVSHDISDFFLAISKSLNYMNSPLQGPSFCLCIIVWTYLRHYVNLRILYSLLTEFSTVGPYELNWETEQFKCLISNVVTFVLLAALQALNLFWLYCLLRSAYKFVFLGVAKDDRSEDEGPELDVAVEREKEDTVKTLTNKVEVLPLLKGNGVSAPPTKRMITSQRRQS
ncbi:longevity assurance proteins LAG1/LAC1 [Biscogniauxia marginata]|nr:longevity assurance proteins LAG1/LAC1 [Biscogniauxia marginata]